MIRYFIMDKQILNAPAMVVTFISLVPYIRSTQRGQTKPHVFSWLIWGLSTLIVFFAQLSDGAGVGAWSIGFSGVVTLYIACLAYRKRADYSITKLDWSFLVMALLSLPLWIWTRNPFWAVVILSTIDTLGFGPTFRKAYHAPYGEELSLYVLTAVRNAIGIAALEHYSWTTVLFPAVVGLVSLIFYAMVLIRRSALSRRS